MKTSLPLILACLLATSASAEDKGDPFAPMLSDKQINDYSGNRPQPPALKDANIQVQLKDGKTEYNFSANTHKVVSRESSKRVAALIAKLRKALADCEAKLDDKAAEKACSEKLDAMEKKLSDQVAENESLRNRVTELEATQQKPNRITVHGGLGPDGVQAEKNDKGQKVSTEQFPLVGLGYQRLVYDQFSVGLTALTGVSPESRTFVGTINIGYDF